MMDWTDRHCRFFLRLLSKHALLYTEMVTTGALLHNDAHRFLRHDDTEHPLALQLGGSVPAELAACARLAEDAGYDEVNLNVGCPSDRVQNNMIGACLMGHPALVADCVKAMRDAVAIPVTVKHRIGINGRDSYAELCDFVGQVRDAGCRSFTVHARIAILEGLSPKENREIPPLRYDVAARLKADFPDLELVLNGGIKTLEECHAHLQTFDGVMLGREAYHNPYLLAEVDQQLFGSTAPVVSRSEALEKLRPYIVAHLQSGGAMHHITRHILGLGQGFPGARRFRQLLSADIHKAPAPGDLRPGRRAAARPLREPRRAFDSNLHSLARPAPPALSGRRGSGNVESLHRTEHAHDLQAGTTQAVHHRGRRHRGPDAITRLKPVDATTNPSLLLKAAAIRVTRTCSSRSRAMPRAMWTWPATSLPWPWARASSRSFLGVSPPRSTPACRSTNPRCWPRPAN